MSHQSENVNRLTVRTIEVSTGTNLPRSNPQRAEVWLFVLPFGRTIDDAEASGKWYKALEKFAQTLNDQSVVAILTSAQDAAETWPAVGDSLQFQLWVAVKLTIPITRPPQQLPEQHAALLILSKYRTSLRHTKTRIGYTYCPACDKTTKDYGGKKHTYHEYGTLVSDVWRDISYTPGEDPTDTVVRLADLFGLEPYRELVVARVAALPSARLKCIESKLSVTAHCGTPTRLDCQLIQGDSLAELRKLPANSVDFCFADPLASSLLYLRCPQYSGSGYSALSAHEAKPRFSILDRMGRAEFAGSDDNDCSLGGSLFHKGSRATITRTSSGFRNAARIPCTYDAPRKLLWASIVWCNAKADRTI